MVTENYRRNNSCASCAWRAPRYMEVSGHDTDISLVCRQLCFRHVVCESDAQQHSHSSFE